MVANISSFNCVGVCTGSETHDVFLGKNTKARLYLIRTVTLNTDYYNNPIIEAWRTN